MTLRASLLTVLAAAILAATWPTDAAAAGPFAHGCPRVTLPAAALTHVDRNRRADRSLVPSGARSVQICDYFGSKVGSKPVPTGKIGTLRARAGLLGRADAISLGREFDELGRAAEGFTSCFFDDPIGSVQYAVFRYRGEPPVTVAISFGGCTSWATNGRRAHDGRPTAELVARLERLAAGVHLPPGPRAVHAQRTAAPAPPRLTVVEAKALLEGVGAESCDGECSAWRLGACRRRGATSVTCGLVVTVVDGDECRGPLTASVYPDDHQLVTEPSEAQAACIAGRGPPLPQSISIVRGSPGPGR